MWFKNLQLFRLINDWNIDIAMNASGARTVLANTANNA